MRRRNFIEGTALLAAGSLGNVFREVVPARLILDLSRTIFTIASDFMGLGYETSSVARLGFLSAKTSVYVQLCRTLGLTGTIRDGGNTSEYASYAAFSRAFSSPETGLGSIVNEAVPRDLGTFPNPPGWRLIWGLNLARGTVEGAVEEANAVLAATRQYLLAFEIGNEPDLFPHREIHRNKGL